MRATAHPTRIKIPPFAVSVPALPVGLRQAPQALQAAMAGNRIMTVVNGAVIGVRVIQHEVLQAEAAPARFLNPAGTTRRQGETGLRML